MYSEFEAVYKKKSLLRLYRILIVVSFLFVCSLFLVLEYFHIINQRFRLLSIVIGVFSFYFIIYLEMLYILVHNKKVNKNNIWDVLSFEIINIFEDLLKERNNKNMVEVLCEFGVTNKEKLMLIISHYNSLISTDSFSLKGIYVSILSISTAIITYISPDGIYLDENKIISILTFLILTSIILSFFGFFIKVYLKFFGKNELYKLIESSLSEIFINYDEYMIKYKRIVTIVDYDCKQSLDCSKVFSDKYIIQFKTINETLNDECKCIIMLKSKKTNKFSLCNCFVEENKKYVSSVYLPSIETYELFESKSWVIKEHISRKRIRKDFEINIKKSDVVFFVEYPCDTSDVVLYDKINEIISCI